MQTAEEILADIAREAATQSDLGAQPRTPLLQRLFRSSQSRLAFADERPLTRLANGILVRGLETRTPAISLVNEGSDTCVHFRQVAVNGGPLRLPGRVHELLRIRYRQMADAPSDVMQGRIPITVGSDNFHVDFHFAGEKSNLTFVLREGLKFT